MEQKNRVNKDAKSLETFYAISLTLIALSILEGGKDDKMKIDITEDELLPFIENVAKGISPIILALLFDLTKLDESNEFLNAA